jgi:capsular polysaccharide transport system permease protein
MSVASSPPAPGGAFIKGLSVQMRVTGALIMRELHTRYGRENIGYMWIFLEPMILASVMGLLHHSGHAQYGSDVRPLPMTVVGYTTFIMFRGIVNRSEGALDSNAPLLYHRMVTIFDIVLSRALLEAAATFTVYVTLMILLVSLGLVAPPARPLYIIIAVLYMFWFSWGHAMIIMANTFENRTAGRLVHPYSYFMIPLSAAFFQVGWLGEPWRSYLMWIPLPHIMELVRYGQFNSATLKYVDLEYLTGWCMVLMWVGLISMNRCRRKMHLQ